MFDSRWAYYCHHENTLDGDRALFSECRRYRYLLTREISARNLPSLGVIMLNPSTADAFRDDPTIRRVRQFATRWGYERILIGNLFALRSPHPRDLKLEAEKAGGDPVGPMNDHWLKWILSHSVAVLAAWGAHPFAVDRAEWLSREASTMGVELLCLGTTGNGSPIHPLARGRNRVPDDAQPRRWA